MKSATTISPATLRLAALILAIATVIASPPAGGTNQAESISLELEVWPLQGRTAHYRIAIDESGRCVYVGVSGTKVAGPSSRLLRPDQLARIASGLRRLGYWELAGEQRLGSSDPLRGFDQLHMVLRVRGGGISKEVQFGSAGGGGLQVLLHDLIEAEVQSEEWRCPHKLAGRDACQFERVLFKEMRATYLSIQKEGAKR